MKNNTVTGYARVSKTKGMAQVALFAALIVLMAFTPFLGYIPLGFTRATIIHIPVIIGSLLLGPKKGAGLGFVFGLTSFINNTINPTVTSFVFTPFYSLGEYSGGVGSMIYLFCPQNSGRRTSLLCVPWSEETAEGRKGIHSRFGAGGSQRGVGQYLAGDEFDLCIFSRCICLCEWGGSQRSVWIYSLSHRYQRGA